MIDMGLSAADRKGYENLLVTNHNVSFDVSVLDLSHNFVGNLSKRTRDGQVTVDTTRSITRSLTLDIVDPDRSITLDSMSPSEGALYADRMIYVTHNVSNPRNTVRYSCPIFTGPISKLARNGAILNLEAQGKECLGLDPVWNTKVFTKGYTYTAVISDLLWNFMGENPQYAQVPSFGNVRLARNISMGADINPWGLAKSLARGQGYYMFYDGRGSVRFKRLSTKPIYRYRDGVGGGVLGNASLGFSMENVYNAVEVTGKKPQKGTQKQPYARVIAPNYYPFSPERLGRNGKPRYIPLRITDEAITTNAEARARAWNELSLALMQSTEVAFDSLPVPHLDEGDAVQVSTSDLTAEFILEKYTIPLNATGVSSVGYVKNVKTRDRATRIMAGSR